MSIATILAEKLQVIAQITDIYTAVQNFGIKKAQFALRLGEPDWLSHGGKKQFIRF
jgi:hypothetical protein